MWRKKAGKHAKQRILSFVMAVCVTIGTAVVSTAPMSISAQAAEYDSTSFDSNTTLTGGDVLKGTIDIRPGVTLTIPDGVTGDGDLIFTGGGNLVVEVTGDTALDVSGSLSILGLGDVTITGGEAYEYAVKADRLRFENCTGTISITAGDQWDEEYAVGCSTEFIGCQGKIIITGGDGQNELYAICGYAEFIACQGDITITGAEMGQEGYAIQGTAGYSTKFTECAGKITIQGGGYDGNGNFLDGRGNNAAAIYGPAEFADCTGAIEIAGGNFSGASGISGAASFIRCRGGITLIGGRYNGAHGMAGRLTVTDCDVRIEGSRNGSLQGYGISCSSNIALNNATLTADSGSGRAIGAGSNATATLVFGKAGGTFLLQGKVHHNLGWGPGFVSDQSSNVNISREGNSTSWSVIQSGGDDTIIDPASGYENVNDFTLTTTTNTNIKIELGPQSYPSTGNSGSGSSGSSRTGADYTPQSTWWIEANQAKSLADTARIGNLPYVRSRRSGSAGIRASAVTELAGLRLEHDTLDAGAVTVRVGIPQPELLKEDTLLSGTVKGDKVDKRQSFCKQWFRNKVCVISLEQQGAWGQPVRIAAKVDLTGMDTPNLYFYSYDVKTNRYKRITAPNYRIDASGYLHLTTEYAGDIIVSEGTLGKQ